MTVSAGQDFFVQFQQQVKPSMDVADAVHPLVIRDVRRHRRDGGLFSKPGEQFEQGVLLLRR
jgi:hypothetical protein